MVKLVANSLIVLAALTAAPAAAHPPPPPDDYYEPPDEPPDDPPEASDDDSPAFNMFGFDMGIGSLPLHGAPTLAMSIGLAVEHPVFKKTRVVGEYDWLWLTRQDTRAMRVQASADAIMPRPDDHASGHRLALGLRRELFGKGVGSTARLFLDGELGGSLALVNDNMTGVAVVPAAFTGLRVGYDLYSRRDDSPSRTFETGIDIRVIALREGLGMTVGLGMYWGN